MPDVTDNRFAIVKVSKVNRWTTWARTEQANSPQSFEVLWKARNQSNSKPYHLFLNRLTIWFRSESMRRVLSIYIQTRRIFIQVSRSDFSPLTVTHSPTVHPILPELQAVACMHSCAGSRAFEESRWCSDPKTCCHSEIRSFCVCVFKFFACLKRKIFICDFKFSLVFAGFHLFECVLSYRTVWIEGALL